MGSEDSSIELRGANSSVDQPDIVYMLYDTFPVHINLLGVLARMSKHLSSPYHSNLKPSEPTVPRPH